LGLTAEAVAFDFISEHNGADAQVLHRVFAVPHALLVRLQALVMGMGLNLSRLGVCDPQGSNAQELCKINFLPHRQMLLQQHKRQFVWRCATALLCGMVLASGVQAAWALWLTQMGTQEATRQHAQQTLTDTQAKHDAVQLALQQLTQRHSQHQTRKRQQAQTAQWQAVLQTNPAAVWYEQLEQEGSAWRLSGQALAKADVQQLQSQLAGLPIWQTPPTLKHWAAWPPHMQIRLPLWQFELVAVLHDTQRDRTHDNAAKPASQAEADPGAAANKSAVPAVP
jgi:Tfp pilus assembly protein PilN